MPGSSSARTSLGDRGVTTGGEHLSDLALERWLAGELVHERLPEGRAARDGGAVGEHLSRCATCQARQRQRSADRSAFASRPDLGAFAEATWRRTRDGAPRARLRPRIVAAGGLLSAAAAVMLLLVRAPRGGDLRAKGGLRLELFVKHPDGTVASMLPDGTAAPGDRLRFRIGAAREGYVGIVSVDGARDVTGYLPAAGPLPAVDLGTHLLDGAVELDAVLGRERLFAFLCAEPLDAATVVAKVRSALEMAGGDPARIDAPPAPLPCTFTSFWFRKVPRS